MWPILACSLLGFTIACERLFAFWKYNFANYFFASKQRQIIALTREGKYSEALVLAKSSESPICYIFAQALEHREAGFTETLEQRHSKRLIVFEEDFPCSIPLSLFRRCLAFWEQ